MGSRGQALKTGGFVEYKYHTIMRDGNTRFIVQNKNEPVKLPEMSNSENVAYVTLGRKGDIKSISFFRGRKKYKEIDIDHRHEGLKPHVHTCNVKESIRDETIPVRILTKHEKTRVQKIIDFYNANGLKEKAKKSYEEAEK